jgi:hypothetical protein
VLSAVILGLSYIGLLVKSEIDNRVQLQSLMASLERIENEQRGNQAETSQGLKAGMSHLLLKLLMASLV